MKIVVSIIFCLISFQVNADRFLTEGQAQNFAESAMDSFVNGEFSKGVNLAKPYWPIRPVEVDGMANQLAQQWPMFEQRFGRSLGYEFLKSESIGDSFVRFYYLHKFQNHAIYWVFSFYNPSEGWNINSIKYLDNLEVLFK
jgi:hypothetical protein